jgi:large subunit ribosomal protein L17
MAVIELVEALTVSQTAVREAEGATKRSVKEKAAKAAPAAAVETVESEAEGPYGPGSAAVLEDGSQPEGFPIKGNVDSMKYHTPESPWFEQTVPEVWFADPASAEAAGFEAPSGHAGEEAHAEAEAASDESAPEGSDSDES